MERERRVKDKRAQKQEKKHVYRDARQARRSDVSQGDARGARRPSRQYWAGSCAPLADPGHGESGVSVSKLTGGVVYVMNDKGATVGQFVVPEAPPVA